MKPNRCRVAACWVFSLLLTIGCAPLSQNASSGSLGQFTGQADIGGAKPGATQYDAARDAYLLTASGSNIWNTGDAFHYVYKQISGDVRFSATVRIITTGGPPHRKAVLMLRQSLDPDSAYGDIALHAIGLTALQIRETRGGASTELMISDNGPTHLCVEKRGRYITASISNGDEPLQATGGEFPIALQDSFYIGLGLCAHDANGTVQAEFTHVKIEPLPAASGDPKAGLSSIEVIPLDGYRRVVYTTPDHIEAANWSRDGQFMVFNRSGRLWKLGLANITPTVVVPSASAGPIPPSLVASGPPTVIDTGTNIHCNNDHGISPDGSLLALSDGGPSRVYVVPIGGGTPRLITPATGNSYWHGWSPDGKTLAFCGQRDGEFDVYTISADGGPETRLTTAPGLDDGPDYSPNGQYIYFNSVRSGSMQIWRMKADGSEQTQITSDEYDNWFAHPSPDGKWIVYLTYPKGTEGHPANKDVMLRLMPTAGGPSRILAKLFGGQGTVNVPSWSPDSKQIAFVSYRPVYQ